MNVASRLAQVVGLLVVALLAGTGLALVDLLGELESSRVVTVLRAAGSQVRLRLDEQYTDLERHAREVSVQPEVAGLLAGSVSVSAATTALAKLGERRDLAGLILFDAVGRPITGWKAGAGKLPGIPAPTMSMVLSGRPVTGPWRGSGVAAAAALSPVIQGRTVKGAILVARSLERIVTAVAPDLVASRLVVTDGNQAVASTAPLATLPEFLRLLPTLSGPGGADTWDTARPASVVPLGGTRTLVARRPVVAASPLWASESAPLSWWLLIDPTSPDGIAFLLIWRMAFLGLGGTLAVSWLFSRLAQRWVGDPLVAMTGRVVAATQGQLTDELPTHHKGEVGDLARSLDGLFRRIAERDSQLTGHVEEQGRKIKDQSRQLEAHSVAREAADKRLARRDEQLRQSQKMEAVGRLASGVAHDFNNLLTVIGGYVEGMVDSLGPDSALTESARMVQRSVDRATALVRQLLSLGRRQTAQPRVLDMNVVVEEMVRLLRRLIGEDVHLDLTLGAGLGRVKADRNQLERIVLNLAMNARDAMPDGGRLAITTHPWPATGTDDAIPAFESLEGLHVVLLVTDTGEGMAEEVRLRIFEPFFTTKAPGRGSGLGLANVLGIVESLGGRIDVTSTPGQGTSFRVAIPVTPEEVPASVESARGGTAPHRDGGTVLLVEDDEAVRMLVRDALERLGYVVLQAESGETALEVAGSFPDAVDVLIADVVLPGMGGKELSEKMKARQPGLKILFVSGYADDDVVRRGILEQEVDFLEKPFTPARLVTRLREIMAAPARPAP